MTTRSSPRTLRAGATLIAAALLLATAAPASAQQQKRPGRARHARGGLAGQWNATVQVGGQDWKTIASFSRAEGGGWKGEWVSLLGVSELRDVKLEKGELSFTLVFRAGDREVSAKFAGRVEGRKLTGTFTSEEGEAPVTGARVRRSPPVVGSWDMVTQVGEHEYKGRLTIAAGEKGKLTGSWKAERGKHEIRDVAFARGKLTFKHHIEVEDRAWDVAFEGKLKGNSLSGLYRSDDGEATSKGTRAGARLIGRWDLEIDSENGPRKQLLVVERDLSGSLGAIPIEKIDFDGKGVKFEGEARFGDNAWRFGFTGEIKKGKLSGELTSDQGVRKVTGKKRRPARRHRPAHR